MAQMEFYTDINFSGTTSGLVDHDIPNVGEFWNDQISSIKVYDGGWTFYSDENYGGWSLTLPPGEYANLTQMSPSFNDVISSARVTLQ